MPFNPKSLANLNKTGRPKGAISKATRWRRELVAPGAELAGTETPTKILAMNMAYFQGEGDKHLAVAKRAAEAGEVDVLNAALDKVIYYKELANEAAVHLAPYVHSRLGTIEVQPDHEAQSFVIRVPDALPDGQAWSHAITDARAITVDAPVNGKGRN